MESQLTPDEAANALREVSDRHRQAYEDPQPRWLFWVVFPMVLAGSVVSDVQPQLGAWVTLLVVGLILLISYASRWKRIGSVLGYRRVPSHHPVWSAGKFRIRHGVMLLAIVAVIAALAYFTRIWEVPFPATLCTLVGGVLALVGHKLLLRASRRDQDSNHG